MDIYLFLQLGPKSIVCDIYDAQSSLQLIFEYLMRKLVIASILVCLIAFAQAQGVVILNRGCKEFDAGGECVSCSTRYYKDDEGICQPVNTNCNTYNPINGDCTSCYVGHVIIEDTCLPEAFFPSLNTPTDPFCNTFKDSKCLKCAYGYFFNEEGKCKQSDPNCREFNQENGSCLSCYPGMQLEESKCVVQAIGNPNTNCNTYTAAGVCQKCSFGYYFDFNRNCQKIPDTCSNFDTNAEKCFACYPGYSLDNNNQCVVSAAEANDFGCNTFENGLCVKCSFGYYFDAGQKCRQIPSTCGNFDTVNGICKECYPGYELNDAGRCIAVEAGESDSGCSSFKNNECVECSFGFYFDSFRKCQQIPSTCSNFDTQNQVCIQCYPGYQLNNNNQCEQSSSDNGCNEFANGACVKCSFGFYFDMNRRCKQIPSTCADFNEQQERCNACYPGYKLDENSICLETEPEDGDSGCSQFLEGNCVKCSFGFYFGQNGKCKQIPSTCSNFDTVSQLCRACYPGYALDQNNQCAEEELSNIDPGCAEFLDGRCSKCSFGFYFGPNGNCKIIPSTCSSFDTQTQECKGCYPGYTLSLQSECVEDIESAGDPGCNQFKDGLCVKCSFGFYFGLQGKCKLVPSTCSSFDTSTETCHACYPGYGLNDFGECIQAQSESGDSGCNEFRDGQCVKCSFGFYFGVDDKCKLIPPTCSNFDTQAERCLSCYSGYGLDASGECVESDQADQDPYCKEFQDNKCVACASGAYFNREGKCQLIDPSCRNFDIQSASCILCYTGYEVNNGKCIRSTEETGDPFCKNFLNGICTECAFRYYKGSEGKCREVNPSCKNYVLETGECTECYIGFKLQDLTCEEDEDILTDSNCAEWKDGVCLKCSTGSFFHPTTGLCKLVDPLCKTFNSVSGSCESCYPAFKLENGKCLEDLYFQDQDPNCAEFQDGFCVKCSQGFFFTNDGTCEAVNPLCESFDARNGNCLTCFLGFVLKDGRCDEDDEFLTDFNCAEFQDGFCVRCSIGYFFNEEGKCKASNPLCKLFNPLNGDCTECYIGFILSNSNCEIDEQFDNGGSLCAENKDGICLRCATRAYFNDEGVCEPVSQFCRTFNPYDGSCQSCYPGFRINGEICEQAPAGEGDGCAEYNNEDGTCVKCAVRRYLEDNKCVQIDDLCANFDYVSKQCVGCYSGYSLLNEKCEITEVEEGKQIENCFAYTPEGSCLQCFDRFFVQNNTCSEVSVFCKSSSKQNGECTDCYTGFTLEDGECIRK